MNDELKENISLNTILERGYTDNYSQFFLAIDLPQYYKNGNKKRKKKTIFVGWEELKELISREFQENFVSREQVVEDLEESYHLGWDRCRADVDDDTESIQVIKGTFKQLKSKYIKEDK